MDVNSWIHSETWADTARAVSKSLGHWTHIFAQKRHGRPLHVSMVKHAFVHPHFLCDIISLHLEASHLHDSPHVCFMHCKSQWCHITFVDCRAVRSKGNDWFSYLCQSMTEKEFRLGFFSINKIISYGFFLTLHPRSYRQHFPASSPSYRKVTQWNNIHLHLVEPWMNVHVSVVLWN